MEPRLLVTVAQQCRAIVLRAVVDLGSDLGGMSIVDLCADNMAESIQDIKCALVIAGLDGHVSPRLRNQYSK